MRRTAFLLTFCGALASAHTTQAADHGSRGRVARSSADAAELAVLAPPANRTTEAQTYGDAAIARAHFRRRTAGAGPVVVDAPLGIVPCEPRAARAGGYACGVDLAQPGYGELYSFTPAYVTAPQVKRFAPDVDESLLPPATAFFLGANDALFGRNN